MRTDGGLIYVRIRCTLSFAINLNSAVNNDIDNRPSEGTYDISL